MAVAGGILDLKGVAADLKVEGRLVGWFDLVRRLNRLSLSAGLAGKVPSCFDSGT